MTTTLFTSIFPLIQGFLLCGSMAVAVSPQNLFPWRQGLMRQHLFAIALFSALADVLMISLGVGGLGELIATNKIVQVAAVAVSATFLFWNGGRALYNVLRGESATNVCVVTQATSGVLATIWGTLSSSLFNPTISLETAMIMGSKSLVFAGSERWVFGIGAILASACWFLALTFFAGKLSPVFRSSMVSRGLDVLTGFIMVGTAAGMVAKIFLPA
jgi:L-lysine exporter family protein LysE/ArgO